MKRMILTRYGEKRQLARLMGVTEVTVWNALNYKHSTKLMDKIRRLAKQRGAIIIDD